MNRDKQFDIFEISSDGQHLWCKAAETFMEAEAIVHTLAQNSGRAYLIIDRQSGARTSISRNDAALGTRRKKNQHTPSSL